jgi:hypothetical protein
MIRAPSSTGMTEVVFRHPSKNASHIQTKVGDLALGRALVIESGVESPAGIPGGVCRQGAW